MILTSFNIFHLHLIYKSFLFKMFLNFMMIYQVCYFLMVLLSHFIVLYLNHIQIINLLIPLTIIIYFKQNHL
jgi:hypothetical protein